MQTLGLSSESKRTDGRLKSIFWPTVENAWDFNYIGQQGFWICLAIGAVQMAGALLVGSSQFIIFGVIAFLIFFIGGMGVREASWPAAAIVFAIFLAGNVNSMTMGSPPSILGIICGGILLSNVRAAFLASEWRPASADEDRPTRFSETLTDKLVDRLPAKAWPILMVPFFIIASLDLLLILAGFAIQMARHSRAL
jgi:hypothetical protein